MVRRAHYINGTSLVVTFWPHPQKVESLYSLKHRLKLIEELGVGVCIVIRFNKKFADIKAVSFIEDILLKRIGAQEIYVGKNFRFGKDAAGDYKTLEGLSKKHGFKLKIFEVIRINNQPISSTYIRSLIKEGRLAVAQKLLNHPVSVLGTVTTGIRLARRLGFPTANINPHHEVIPPTGIYVVRVILNRMRFFGVCYIGKRPTFAAQGRVNIEVYILNLKKNIYGKYLEIQFIEKIREDKKFSSVSALVKQIEKDILAAKKLFFLH
jgi:riboflavin kinase/FMN adenylyltransferase